MYSKIHKRLNTFHFNKWRHESIYTFWNFFTNSMTVQFWIIFSPCPPPDRIWKFTSFRFDFHLAGKWDARWKVGDVENANVDKRAHISHHLYSHLYSHIENSFWFSTVQCIFYYTVYLHGAQSLQFIRSWRAVIVKWCLILGCTWVHTSMQFNRTQETSHDSGRCINLNVKLSFDSHRAKRCEACWTRAFYMQYWKYALPPFFIWNKSK